ncbi:hypothetical protein RhiirA5_430875 [Rhizophagus irregularis]|uniref:Uncharacterized protein n=1 Tax=Rhizophagus irregularis TaxID=588596 RepID=A0A2N0NVZ5_9GLOM|nr:hypothetical protein RhiirA5_430875 [Rhizophagus irregularis]
MGVRVDESTITRILKSKNKRLGTEIANPEAKRHKSVLVPELELALKEFVLNYQHKTILSAQSQRVHLWRVDCNSYDDIIQSISELNLAKSLKKGELHLSYLPL